jgi:gas vesicle protein
MTIIISPYGKSQGKKKIQILFCRHKTFTMNNTGKILTALAAGVVAGTLLGILIAPDKGSATRKKITDSKDKVQDDIKTAFRKGKDRINQIREDIAESIVDREEYA